LSEVVLNNENFEAEVMQSDVPVLIDFWADWCMPCRMIAPLVEELAGEYAGRLKVGKVDVDANPELAGRFNIISIPTLMVVKGGEVVNQQAGAGSKAAIEGLFSDYL